MKLALVLLLQLSINNFVDGKFEPKVSDYRKQLLKAQIKPLISQYSYYDVKKKLSKIRKFIIFIIINCLSISRYFIYCNLLSRFKCLNIFIFFSHH